MMKKLFLALLLTVAAGLTAHPATTSTNYVATVTFTNVVAGVTNGDSITVNSDTRLYTNGTLADAALWIQSTNIVGHAATNTWYHLGATPPTGVDTIGASGANAITIRSKFDTALTVSVSAGVGTVSYVTNVFQPVRPLVLPIDGLLVASTRTNAQNRLAEALNLSYATGVVASAATMFTNFANLYNAQNLSNKTFFSTAMEAPTLTNITTLSGILGALTNGTLQGVAITNALGFTGILGATTNGTLQSPILNGPTLTNGVNYGNAFSSPGSIGTSEQFGTGAAASQNGALAVGNSASASGVNSAAIGNGASVELTGSTAIGNGASATNAQATALGNGATARAQNSLALGHLATVDEFHDNSVALGQGTTTTKTNQVLVGNSSHLVEIPGRLLVGGTQTNAVLTGPTKIGASGGPYGTLSIARLNVSSIAAGANTLDIAGSSYIRITGTAGAAFSIDGITNSASGNLDGAMLTLHNSSSDTMTIANQSGLETVAGNRIITTTDVGESFGGSGVALLVYDSAASRWVLMNPPKPTAVFGRIFASENALVVGIASAGTWYQVTNFYFAGLSSGVTADNSNHRLQATTEGYYEVEADPSFSGTGSSTFDFAVFTNGVIATNLVLQRKLGTGGDVGSAALSGFAYLPTNAIVDLRVKSDSASDTITVVHGGLRIKKL